MLLARINLQPVFNIYFHIQLFGIMCDLGQQIIFPNKRELQFLIYEFIHVSFLLQTLTSVNIYHTEVHRSFKITHPHLQQLCVKMVNLFFLSLSSTLLAFSHSLLSLPLFPPTLFFSVLLAHFLVHKAQYKCLVIIKH